MADCIFCRIVKGDLPLKPTFVSFITHGLAVNHAHIHILPRYREKEFVPDIKKFSAKELRETAALIHDAIEKK
ncbi:hypothetical protein HY214_01125 [Candidatus Roizmanbacteria bacterium]|nr:hypothetical protein [Candidatus Roizmanbacteria bacterium]